jgi:hypothetical protein
MPTRTTATPRNMAAAKARPADQGGEIAFAMRAKTARQAPRINSTP